VHHFSNIVKPPNLRHETGDNDAYPCPRKLTPRKISNPAVRRDTRGQTGDCVVRSIAIASGLPYQCVYHLINAAGQCERTGTRKRRKSNARTRLYKQTVRRVLADLGWRWIPNNADRFGLHGAFAGQRASVLTGCVGFQSIRRPL
jgi:hypothetical protein